MPKYIDAEKFAEHISGNLSWNGEQYNAASVISDLKTFPASDVEPVRHGKWVPGKEIARTMLGDETLAVEYSDFRCSSCGRRYKEYVLTYRCCPNCGAKMGKEGDNAEVH